MPEPVDKPVTCRNSEPTSPRVNVSAIRLSCDTTTEIAEQIFVRLEPMRHQIEEHNELLSEQSNKLNALVKAFEGLDTQIQSLSEKNNSEHISPHRPPCTPVTIKSDSAANIIQKSNIEFPPSLRDIVYEAAPYHGANDLPHFEKWIEQTDSIAKVHSLTDIGKLWVASFTAKEGAHEWVSNYLKSIEAEHASFDKFCVDAKAHFVNNNMSEYYDQLARDVALQQE